MQQRERMFFGVAEMTAWRFVGINTLNLLSLMHDKKDLHGKMIQFLMWRLFGEVWTSGNDLTYTVLNTYEKEGYVRSYWEKDEDSNKKSIRHYKITDAGKLYLKESSRPFVETLGFMSNLYEQSMKFIWGNSQPHPHCEASSLISSSTFTLLNVLNYLYRVKHEISMDNNNSNFHKLPKCLSKCVYAKEIKDSLNDLYCGNWQPSDGLLYPLLSDLETQGYISSKWIESDLRKKRTTRCYSILDSGDKLFLEMILPNSGLKNKLIQLKTLCTKSSEIISGNSTSNIKIILDIIQKSPS